MARKTVSEERAAKVAEAQERRTETRNSLIRRLHAEGSPDLAEMLEKCGQELRMRCVHCGHRKTAETRCKKRWCPSCAYFIAAERVDKYRAAAEAFEWPLFVTLTVKNTIDPEGLQRVKDSWGKLRRRKLITTKVRSGIVGYEMTNKGHGWHPHIHALLDCRWLALHVPEPVRTDSAEVKKAKCRAAAEELSALWCQVIGQETASVKIRRGDPQALVEVLKYSVKGNELVECQDKASDLIRVMLGMRLITTFGEIRKKVEDEDPEEEDNTESGCECENCGSRGTTMPEEIIEILMRKTNA